MTRENFSCVLTGDKKIAHKAVKTFLHSFLKKWKCKCLRARRWKKNYLLVAGWNYSVKCTRIFYFFLSSFCCFGPSMTTYLQQIFHLADWNWPSHTPPQTRTELGPWARSENVAVNNRQAEWERRLMGGGVSGCACVCVSYHVYGGRMTFTPPPHSITILPSFLQYTPMHTGVYAVFVSIKLHKSNATNLKMF